jgi:hypothetical protein
MKQIKFSSNQRAPFHVVEVGFTGHRARCGCKITFVLSVRLTGFVKETALIRRAMTECQSL